MDFDLWMANLDLRTLQRVLDTFAGFGDNVESTLSLIDVYNSAIVQQVLLDPTRRVVVPDTPANRFTLIAAQAYDIITYCNHPTIRALVVTPSS